MDPTSAAVLDSADPEDLVVIVAPEEICTDVDPDLAHWCARFGRDRERPNGSGGSDVAQLRAEITRLERELERKEAHLDAVVTRNEQILAERTRAYRAKLAEHDRDGADDHLWHGRRQEWNGPLSRARRWMRGLFS